jgi:hypothetical protein
LDKNKGLIRENIRAKNNEFFEAIQKVINGMIAKIIHRT